MILLVGTVLSWAAMITYFFVVVRWPDLRDSGIPSIALAWVGSAAALLWALRRWRSSRRRWLPAIGLGFAVLPAAFLSHYVLVLSYDLPDAAGSPQEGDPARPFRLSDQDGKTVALDDFVQSSAAAGRWLVLDFFRGHW